MELVEVRELEGPNLFLLEPAIKIEVHTSESFRTSDSPHLYAATTDAPADVSKFAELIRDALNVVGIPDCPVTIVPMETEGNFSVVFPWSDRRIAREIERTAKTLADGEPVDLIDLATRTNAIRTTEPEIEDRPAMIHDDQRAALTIAVTGTNGKTTTTRLLAHIFRSAGQRVGWSSSSGVYINGEEVLSGDYSGPRGAERVLTDPDVDIAITETARGGILLRGVVCQSVDVSVFTNISADHLDLQGVRSVQGLAWAKGLITRITHADGYAVLNGSDPLIMDATRDISAQKFLVSRDPEAPELVEHGAAGGLVMTVVGENMTLIETGIPTVVLPITEIPITSGGVAGFMVENSLFAAAAALAAGATMTQVREGLTSFENTPEMNPGRLNIFERDGAKVIVDFAHNEAGLVALLDFAQSLRTGDGRVIAIIGTAGDRNDSSLIEIGRLATMSSDLVIAKNTTKYLRGRSPDDLMDHYLKGIQSGRDVPYEISENELTAVQRALEIAQPGDVIAVMAHEYVAEIGELFAAGSAD
jgi:cyanophycin synthetase